MGAPGEGPGPPAAAGGGGGGERRSSLGGGPADGRAAGRRLSRLLQPGAGARGGAAAGSGAGAGAAPESDVRKAEGRRPMLPKAQLREDMAAVQKEAELSSAKRTRPSTWALKAITGLQLQSQRRDNLEDIRHINMRKLSTLCVNPEFRAEEDILRLVEMTTSLCQFFRTMPIQMRMELCRVIMPESYAKGDVVFNQGDIGDKFYVILQGKAEVRVWKSAGAPNRAPNGPGWVCVATLQRGDSFGDLALLRDKPRGASIVIPTTRAEVLTIDKTDFRRILNGLYGSTVGERARFLRMLRTFSSLPTHKLKELAQHMSVAVFQAATQFQMDKDNRLYFVVQGECRLCYRRSFDAQGDIPRGEGNFYKGDTISRIGPGNFFGETCLFKDLKRGEWFVDAATEVKLYFISEADFWKKLDSDVQDIIRREAAYKQDYYERRVIGRLRISQQKTHRASLDSNRSLRGTRGAVAFGGGGGDWRGEPGIGERGHESIMQELDMIKSSVTSRTIARTRQTNWSGSP